MIAICMIDIHLTANIHCTIGVMGQYCGPCLMQLSAQEGHCSPGIVIILLCNLLLIKKLLCFIMFLVM